MMQYQRVGGEKEHAEILHAKVAQVFSEFKKKETHKIWGCVELIE